MTHVQSDKCNLAWFKLAEFVARREKERALGIYRLLVHSLPDEAIAQQLEGDLLLAFNDAKALVCYEKAAALYEQAQKYTEAQAIYEHCILIINAYTWAERAISLEKYYKYLIKILIDTGKTTKATQVLELRSKKLLESHDDKEALDFIKRFVEEYPETSCFSTFYEQFFFLVLERYSCTLGGKTNKVPAYSTEHIEFFVKKYIVENAGQQLNSFLSHMAVLCEPAHEYALGIAQTFKI